MKQKLQQYNFLIIWLAIFLAVPCSIKKIIVDAPVAVHKINPNGYKNTCLIYTTAKSQEEIIKGTAIKNHFISVYVKNLQPVCNDNCNHFFHLKVKEKIPSYILFRHIII